MVFSELLVDEKNAVVWRGPMASSAIRQFVTDVYWDELDYLVVDMPPGTGDIHLTLLQTVPVTGAVIVTTPQDVALADAKKGIAMFGQAQLNVPLLGLVENMSYFTDPQSGNRTYIFGEGGAEKAAKELGIELIAQLAVPLVHVHTAHRYQAVDGGVSFGIVHMAHGHAAQLLEKPHHVFMGQVAEPLHLLEGRQRQLVPLIVGDPTARVLHQHILQLEGLKAGRVAQRPLAVLSIGQLTRLAELSGVMVVCLRAVHCISHAVI